MKTKLLSPFTLLCVCILCLFNSCRQIDVFEKHIPIPRYEWKSSYAAEGSFIIKDTLSAYNLSIVLRHTDAYAYNNIWLSVGLQSPGDTLYFQKIDLSLGSDANGWEGTGMNDIWEVRKSLTARPRRFKKMGEYRFRINHIMRDEPLKAVMSAGLRVERAH